MSRQPSKTDADYLRDILRELADVAEFTIEGEFSFYEDVKTQKAVIRSYEVIGEICKRLSNDTRQAHPEIDWRKLMMFRDYLAHNYEYLIMRYLWDAVADLPNLRQAIEAILVGLDSTKDKD